METIIKACPVITRRYFDVAIDLSAVWNWQAGGISTAVVAKELVLAKIRLFAWRQLPPAVAKLRARLDAALGNHH